MGVLAIFSESHVGIGDYQSLLIQNGKRGWIFATNNKGELSGFNLKSESNVFKKVPNRSRYRYELTREHHLYSNYWSATDNVSGYYYRGS